MNKNIEFEKKKWDNRFNDINKNSMSYEKDKQQTKPKN